MAGTFTQMLVHIVFSTKLRMPMIQEDYRDELEKIICGIIRSRGQRPIAIYCMPDHTHILVGINGDVSISDLVRDIKSMSSRKANEMRRCRTHFAWQEGYGAFTHNNKDLHHLAGFVLGQAEHHRRKGFETEYLEILEAHNVPYDPRYVFG